MLLVKSLNLCQLYLFLSFVLYLWLFYLKCLVYRVAQSV
jgi:hypothetical protein